MHRFPLALALSAAVALPGLAAAQDRMLQTAINARQGVFQNYQLMLMNLGGMARGNIPYDAATAQAAADNLVALTELEARFSWPAGTDNQSMEGTRATGVPNRRLARRVTRSNRSSSAASSMRSEWNSCRRVVSPLASVGVGVKPLSPDWCGS